MHYSYQHLSEMQIARYTVALLQINEMPNMPPLLHCDSDSAFNQDLLYDHKTCLQVLSFGGNLLHTYSSPAIALACPVWSHTSPIMLFSATGLATNKAGRARESSAAT